MGMERGNGVEIEIYRERCIEARRKRGEKRKSNTNDTREYTSMINNNNKTKGIKHPPTATVDQQ